ncbi:MAG TPA: DNA topoisomerase [Fastidiosipila sp.]|nr:DNA topoisomerase [Fastidiosipila sp.]
MAKKQYGNESITALRGPDRVRLRPGVIFGSDDLHGCFQAFFEILSNSIDEAREGYGKTIKVTRFADHSLQIEDEARGIPLDFNPREKRFNWELVFCELYAGGKYYNAEGGHYTYSLGLNGLGACATQYASSWYDVTVWRDQTKYSLRFEKGENVGGLQKEPFKGRRTGTTQRFMPDLEVFTEINIPKEWFERVLKQQAIVNAGITFEFIDKIDNTSQTYCYAEGVLGYVEELAATDYLSAPFLIKGEGEGSDRKDKEPYRAFAEIAFSFTNRSPQISYFHNSSWLEHGGSPDRAVRSAFVSEVDRWIKSAGKYRANESKIAFQDIEDSLILVTSSFSTVTSYANQTKKAISNRFIQEFMTDLIRSSLEIWFIEHQAEGLRVVDQLLANKRSRESAEKQRLNLRKKLMGKTDFTNRVANFVDCRSKDIEERELYIVEGNSALGSVKMARDSEFQAVIPLRGKILNCLKADYAQIFRNQIIVDLIRILGCGVEISGKHVKDITAFDIDNLRFGKVIICTDADVDGFQIRTLILAMFYRLMPSLISAGKIHIAESPLYEITHTDKRLETTYFAYSEPEKNEIVAGLNGGKIKLQRSKGLGENEPEMMWQTTMNPETRRLIAVVPEAAESMREMFDILLGDDLPGRKLFIETYGQDYMGDLDVV